MTPFFSLKLCWPKSCLTDGVHLFNRSNDFHDFLSRCVVKSAEMRSSAAELLEVG